MLPPEEIGSHGKTGHHSVWQDGCLVNAVFCSVSWISHKKTKL